MGKLLDMVAAAEAGRAPVISPAHYQWMEKNRGEIVYTPEAIQFAIDVWSGKFKRPRDARYSPSGLGGCPRATMLGFEGFSGDKMSVGTADIMACGTRTGLHWQMEGISAGYLRDCEGWRSDGHDLSGSVDGICVKDGGIFECKEMISHLHRRRVIKERKPVFSHLVQLHAYFRLWDTDRASLLYVNRDNQEHYEFRIYADPAIEDALDELLARLDGFVDTKTLPSAYEECVSESSLEWRKCFQKDNCKAQRLMGR